MAASRPPGYAWPPSALCATGSMAAGRRRDGIAAMRVKDERGNERMDAHETIWSSWSFGSPFLVLSFCGGMWRKRWNGSVRIVRWGDPACGVYSRARFGEAGIGGFEWGWHRELRGCVWMGCEHEACWSKQEGTREESCLHLGKWLAADVLRSIPFFPSIFAFKRSIQRGRPPFAKHPGYARRSWVRLH